MAGQEPKQAKREQAAEQAAEQAERATVVEEIEEEEDDLDSYDEEEEDIMFDPMQELGRVLEPFNDTLQGILEALEKQNKILYKVVSVMEGKK